MSDVGTAARRPLDGRRVLLLRPEGRGDEMAAALRIHGAHPVHAPLITTTPLVSSPQLRDAVTDIAVGRYDWLAVTSPAGVDALRDTAAHLGVPLAVAPRTRVAAVGPGTAAALVALGIRVDLVPGAPGSAPSESAPSGSAPSGSAPSDSGAPGRAAPGSQSPSSQGPSSAAALAAAWPAEEPGRTVLLPRSSRAGRTLPDALAATGHVVREVTAYRTDTHPLPAELAEDVLTGGIAAVVFTSGSTVHAFAGSFPDVRRRRSIRSRCVAIGQPTAEVLAEVGLPVDAVASAPTPDGILAALMSLRHPDSHSTDDTGSTS